MSNNTQTAKLIEIREQEKEIAKIAEAAKAHLKHENNITVTSAIAIPTIAYAFLREAIAYVNQNKSTDSDFTLNLMQLIDLGVSYRENEDAEKEGNYTPFAAPGQEFKLLVKDDADTEE